MVHEHWLYLCTLSKLNNSSEYVFFGSSAMGEKLNTGPFYGRPYGGTVLLIKNDLSHFVTNVVTTERFIYSFMFIRRRNNTQKHCKDSSRQDKSGNEALTTALATRVTIIQMQNRITQNCT